MPMWASGDADTSRSEGVFHSLYYRIEEAAFGNRIRDGENVHQSTPAGEHDLLVIYLVAAVAAQHEPRTTSRPVRDLVVPASIGDKPSLEAVGRLFRLVVPAANEELRVRTRRHEVVEGRLFITFDLMEQLGRIGEGETQSCVALRQPLSGDRLQEWDLQRYR